MLASTATGTHERGITNVLEYAGFLIMLDGAVLEVVRRGGEPATVALHRRGAHEAHQGGRGEATRHSNYMQ